MPTYQQHIYNLINQVISKLYIYNILNVRYLHSMHKLDLFNRIFNGLLHQLKLTLRIYLGLKIVKIYRI